MPYLLRHITYHTPSGDENILAVKVANTFFTRLRGLIGTAPNNTLPLLLTRTNQIHMFFMTYPLDVYYISEDGIIVDRDLGFFPWKAGKKRKQAVSVLEIPSGTLEPIPLHTQLSFLT